MRPSRMLAVLALLPLAATSAVAQTTTKELIEIVKVHKAAALRYTEAAPQSMFTFRPTPEVRTFAEQIEHAAGSDAYIVHLAVTGSAKGIPAMGDSTKYRYNKEALKAYVIAAMDHTIAMLEAITPAQMDAQIVQFNNKVTRRRALLELLDHFPWTLGQTVPYLRLNKITPPEYSPF